MTQLKQADSKKWLNAFVAMCGIFFAYVSFAFISQMGIWFDLEARVTYFSGIAQSISVLIGLITFITFVRNQKIYGYLEEVYRELTKVTWAEKNETIKLTIGIVIGLIFTCVVLGLVDFIIRKLLNLLY